jgi:16S rRNA processing protein RimM
VTDSDQLVVGSINGVYGIKGWVKVFSHTSPIEQILLYQPWSLHKGSKQVSVEVKEGKLHGKGIIALPDGFETRNDAESLVGYEIRIDANQLPELPEGEFYWHELEGMQVVNRAGEVFGVVDRMIETGANDVMVVSATSDSVDDEERLIPFVIDEIVDEIDMEQRTLTVNWEKDY